MANLIKVIVMPLMAWLSIMMASAETTSNVMYFGFNGALDTPHGKFLTLIYTEAFKRLGYTFTVETFPAKRASMLSDNGSVDGELSRVYQYQETHPNVIRVDTPHWKSGFLGVSLKPEIKLSGWNALKNTDYRINYLRGTQGVETNLSKVVGPLQIELVDSETAGLRKVLLGRADLYIDTERVIVNALGSDEFKESGLRVAGIMEEFTGHAYLHKRHKELVPKLAAILADMKKEGLFIKYRTEAKLKPYFEQ